jgi:hypothetical protein
MIFIVHTISGYQQVFNVCSPDAYNDLWVLAINLSNLPQGCESRLTRGEIACLPSKIALNMRWRLPTPMRTLELCAAGC